MIDGVKHQQKIDELKKVNLRVSFQEYVDEEEEEEKPLPSFEPDKTLSIDDRKWISDFLYHLCIIPNNKEYGENLLYLMKNDNVRKLRIEMDIQKNG